MDSATSQLAALFETEVDGVFSFLLSRCRVRAVAEDLTNETFAAAVRHHRSGRGSEVTPAWLRTVARRRLIDHWRASAAHDRRVDALTSELTRRSNDASAHDAVELALESLPDTQRAVLVLRYLEGFSVSEVADALEITYRAAESHLARARNSFRRAFEEEQR